MSARRFAIVTDPSGADLFLVHAADCADLGRAREEVRRGTLSAVVEVEAETAEDALAAELNDDFSGRDGGEHPAANGYPAGSFGAAGFSGRILPCCGRTKEDAMKAKAETTKQLQPVEVPAATVAAIIKARDGGATWRECDAIAPRSYQIYWRAVGAEARAKSPAAAGARKAWETRKASAPKAEAPAKASPKASPKAKPAPAATADAKREAKLKAKREAEAKRRARLKAAKAEVTK